MGTYK